MLIPLQMTSDARVVHRVLEGRRDDFAVLVDRYYRAVLSVVRARLESPADAEDVAQEAFVSAYQKLDTLHAPNRFGPWLMSIARNTAYSWTRRRKLEVLVPNVTDIAERAEEPGVERDELRKIVRGKLMEMDPEQREILMLFYFGGNSLGEVASLLDISRAAAAKRLQRARAVLGSEFLKAVGEAEKPEDAKQARKNVMAAVATAPVAWKAEAAAAGWASLVLVKVVLALLAVGAIGTGAAFLYKHINSQMIASVTQAPAKPASVDATPAAAEAPAVAPEAAVTPPAVEDESLPKGPGTIESQLVDNETDMHVAGADVTAELINWGPRQMPPEKTFKKTVKTDANGMFKFDKLPVGVYCVSSVTASQCGANDWTVMSDGRGSGPRMLWMRPRVSIGGKVTGPDGNGVAGAVLYPVQHLFFPNEEFDHPQIAALRVTTAQDGSFKFPFILPGAWKFYVLSPNLPPVMTDFKIMEGEIDIKIETPGTLTGVVLDKAANAPKPGLTVRAYQGLQTVVSAPDGNDEQQKVGRRVMMEAKSELDGTFRIANLAPGKYKVELDDTVLLNASPDTEFEVKPGAETFAEIGVAQCATVLGRVYNKDTGEGLEGIFVQAFQSSNYEATTDANGEYILTGLTPGEFYFNLSAPKEKDPSDPTPYITRRGIEVNPPRTLTVGLGQVVEDYDFAIAPPAEVKGRVIDRNGRPVQAADVYMNGFSNCKTDAEGRFALKDRGVKEGHIWAQKDKWRSEAVQADFDADNVLTLKVPAGGTVSGRVLSAEGKPRAFHRVHIEPIPREGYAFIQTADANTNGEFAFENLAAGDYLVQAYAPRGTTQIGSANISLPQNGVVRDLVIQPQPQGTMSIAGRMKTFDGGTLYAGQVSIGNGPPVRAGADGRYVIAGLADQEYTLVATAIGYSPVTLEGVAAGRTNVDITFGPLATLTGVVTEADTGSPVKAYQISCASSGQIYAEKVTTYLEQAVQSETGEFKIADFAALPVTLRVNAPGYAPCETQLTLKGGEPNHVEVRMHRGAAVTGFVLDPAGGPVAGALVSPWNSPQPGVRTGADGSFRVGELASGETLTLIASSEPYAPECIEVTPLAGAEVPLTFTLKPAGSVLVHALLDGAPLKEYDVGLESQCYAPASGAGRLGLLNQVPEGEAKVFVYVWRNDQEPLQKELAVMVVAGQTTEVEVQFQSDEAQPHDQ